jgi:UDP-3-O-[3-hydroxymyristoyl] glucosamine N-acyltransferase
MEKIPEGVPVLSNRGAIAGRDGVEHDSPREALLDILPLFDRREKIPSGVHPGAFVAPDSAVGEGVSIGPGCVVSEGAVIGDRTVILANSFVGRNVVIGSDCRIESCVSLHDFVEVGNRVLLHSGVALGCDGFGFIPSIDGVRMKIPQIGTVIIEDDVEIGANSTVDRATFGATRIRRGAKLGSLLHIAHNCDIGEDCVIAGCGGFGGSSKLGRGSIVAGMVGVADHVSIGEGVTVAGRSGVTKDIAGGLTVSGFPARRHMEETRFQASLRRVEDHARRLRSLEKLFGKLTSGKREDEKDA